jgi:hypothetical protein
MDRRWRRRRHWHRSQQPAASSQPAALSGPTSQEAMRELLGATLLALPGELLAAPPEPPPPSPPPTPRPPPLPTSEFVAHAMGAVAT